MLTMLLGGLWHGAAWTFVVWGGIHGGFLVFEQRRRERLEDAGLEPPPDTLGRRVVGRLVTFHVVCLAWVFFRSPDFTIAKTMLTRLVTAWGDPSPLVTGSVLLAVAVGVLMQYTPSRVLERSQIVLSRLSPVATGLVLAVGLLVIDALGPQGVAPFIYFAF